ncbi:MAG: hypothetical protein GY765_13560 [bacterium]|nr:hypothetical protein [bacterium]
MVHLNEKWIAIDPESFAERRRVMVHLSGKWVAIDPGSFQKKEFRIILPFKATEVDALFLQKILTQMVEEDTLGYNLDSEISSFCPPLLEMIETEEGGA